MKKKILDHHVLEHICSTPTLKVILLSSFQVTYARHSAILSMHFFLQILEAEYPRMSTQFKQWAASVGVQVQYTTHLSPEQSKKNRSTPTFPHLPSFAARSTFSISSIFSDQSINQWIKKPKRRIRHPPSSRVNCCHCPTVRIWTSGVELVVNN